MYKPTSHFRHLLLIVFIASVAGLASAQQIGVTGTVSDPSGEPLIGVSVIVSGTPSGTTTAFDGKFSIKADPKGRLRFSYVGFEAREIDIDGRQVIDVVLDESPEMLDEVVVIGYGTMDKKELTSAISHISEKDFLSVSSLDPSMMIQGKVPGVSITNTGAGDPNNQASIQIRGVSSRSAGLGPLIVIDGVPGGNLTNINPNDIASFDILKDASDYREVRLGWGDRGVDLGGNISVELSALGVEGDDWNMRDLWRHADEGKAPATITVQLPAHGCKIIRLSK